MYRNREPIAREQIASRASRAVKSIIFGNYRLLVGVDKQKKTPRTRNGNDNASSSHPAAFAQSPRKSSAVPTCVHVYTQRSRYIRKRIRKRVRVNRTDKEGTPSMKNREAPAKFHLVRLRNADNFSPTTSPTFVDSFCRRYRIGEDPSCFLTRFAFHARGSIVRSARGNRTITGPFSPSRCCLFLRELRRIYSLERFFFFSSSSSSSSSRRNCFI